jgi:hypothetical protein
MRTLILLLVTHLHLVSLIWHKAWFGLQRVAMLQLLVQPLDESALSRLQCYCTPD